MKLSPAAEYAVRGVAVLAENYGGGPISLSKICETRELPKQYLTKIFASLAKADIVLPVRGKHGGYLLAREPKNISLLDVIEAIEGRLVLNFCQYDPPRCEQYKCPFRKVWGDLQEIFRKKLASVTLAECV